MMRYKMINLKDIGEYKDAVETFDTERDAVVYMRGIACALALVGYKIISMPCTCGVSYDNPQYLVAVKYLNPEDENTEREEIRFALMSVDDGEVLTVERVSDIVWGKEDNVGYEIRRESNDDEYLKKLFEERELEFKKNKNDLDIYEMEAEYASIKLYVVK